MNYLVQENLTRLVELEKEKEGLDIQQTIKNTHLRVVAVFLCIHEKKFKKHGCNGFLEWLFKDSSSKNELCKSKFAHLLSKKEITVDISNQIKDAFIDQHPFIDKMLMIILGLRIKDFLDNRGSLTPDKPRSHMEIKNSKQLTDDLFSTVPDKSYTRTKSSEISKNDASQIQRSPSVRDL